MVRLRASSTARTQATRLSSPTMADPVSILSAPFDTRTTWATATWRPPTAGSSRAASAIVCSVAITSMTAARAASPMRRARTAWAADPLAVPIAWRSPQPRATLTLALDPSTCSVTSTISMRSPPSWVPSATCTTEMIRRSRDRPYPARAMLWTSRTTCFGALVAVEITWTSSMAPRLPTTRAALTDGTWQIASSRSPKFMPTNLTEDGAQPLQPRKEVTRTGGIGTLPAGVRPDARASAFVVSQWTTGDEGPHKKKVLMRPYGEVAPCGIPWREQRSGSERGVTSVTTKSRTRGDSPNACSSDRDRGFTGDLVGRRRCQLPYHLTDDAQGASSPEGRS